MRGPPTQAPAILHLHSTFGTGGKELRCAQLINAWGKQARHSIVSAVPDQMEAAKLISPPLAVNYPSEFPSLQGRPTPGRLHNIAKVMQQYDLVLTYNWGAMDAVMAHTLFSKKLDLPPLIHHEDGFNEDEQTRLKPSRNLYRRLALSGAHRLIVPSEILEEIALETWHQPMGKVSRISNGIETLAFSKRPKKHAIKGLEKQAGELWVGTLAGLRAVKNVPRLVRAFAMLPEHCRLVIVGEGPEKERIEQEATALGIRDRVSLPGFVKRPERYVGLFDIFALSSDTEQFPISVVEAMAASVPVAAPAVGDVAGMVSEENAPFVTAKGDGDALGQSLKALAEDAELRQVIGEANRLKAMGEFDQLSMIGSYGRLYWGAMGLVPPRFAVS